MMCEKIIFFSSLSVVPFHLKQSLLSVSCESMTFSDDVPTHTASPFLHTWQHTVCASLHLLSFQLTYLRRLWASVYIPTLFFWLGCMILCYMKFHNLSNLLMFRFAVFVLQAAPFTMRLSICVCAQVHMYLKTQFPELELWGQKSVCIFIILYFLCPVALKDFDLYQSDR